MTGTASQRLRDLVSDLPAEIRRPWVIHGLGTVVTLDDEGRADHAVATSIGGRRHVASLIAAVASPDRGLLLAELLEALDNVRGKHFVEVEHVQTFENALRALEAAITAGQT